MSEDNARRDATLLHVYRGVLAWQADPMAHPLTCGNDSRHRNLVPNAMPDAVVLTCPDCDYTQRIEAGSRLGDLMAQRSERADHAADAGSGGK